MKIHILSDLHNEFSKFVPPKTEADVVVLAGDIDNHRSGVYWAAATFDKPVIYVAGNHEYYHDNTKTLPAELRAAAKGTNVQVLDNYVTFIDGVRFVGSTLWTDFKLGSSNDWEIEESKYDAASMMNDFNLINYGGRKLLPRDTQAFFADAVEFIQRELAKPFDGKTVVVTHHSPSPKSVHARFAGHPINAAFSSDLEYLMQEPNAPVLWIHGHTHDAFDYVVNGCTRVVANPRGYTSRHSVGQENEFFQAGLVVEI
ncbi:MAG: metallophosphoesterase [Rhodocyclaceae bacterium]|nr:metallophosphoesterase [Rhodocyclaceae bacterium]MCA3083052.1 metallophosphoesterase [Rhodocyclaceae bacterium]